MASSALSALATGTSTAMEDGTKSTLFVAALWGTPGGMGVFKLDAASGEAKEVARVSGLTMANRIVLVRPVYAQETEVRVHALVPLESTPGGLERPQASRNE